jgi:hypothetical protein
LIEPPPRALAVAAELELPTHALAAWTRWADAPTAAEKLAEHMQDLAEPLRIAVTELVAAATARLETLDTVWRPLAAEMAEWLPSGKRVLAERDLLDDLKHAEAWLKDAEQRIQARRLEPLQSRSVEIWEMLRQQSNVSLASVTLSGRSKRRRVDLDVQVDGETSIALGVMSQGELNSLALSLFLPRMTLPDSPFHFMVIDDPVQAMDPHKVDGLARVLDEVAKTRQVVIFTHDTRLQEAVRRLKIDATILEVQRDTKSRVRVVENDDAVTRYLRDANTVATKLSKKLVGRALPGHCRGAIEAACLETIRRRRLGRGDRHADVDFEIAEARRVFDLLALALFDDRDKGGQVFGEINRRIDAKAADNLRYCKEGVHGNFDGDPFALIEATTKITKLVRGAA